MQGLVNRIKKMAETTGSRLNRIEEKVDKLAETMVSLARAEEKIGSLMDDHQKMYERLNRFSQKLDEIEKKVDDNHRTVCVINKLFWITIVAVTGSIVAHFVNL